MDLEYVKDVLRKWASKNPDIRTLFIYGSRASGDFSEGSDLDVAIELNRKNGHITGHSLWTSCGTKLEQELQSLFPYKIHLEYYDKKKKDLVKDIVKTGIENCSVVVYSRDKEKKPKDEQKE